ncbi:MAG: hypothetical protein Unbinned5784contig1000_19 [Prokaryotic dsDNA virus sp.]|nr:MAG: hypothetical protein Unbinned5784contig1000_19 [Prokaryotic dsDNA virus sp.]
MSVSVKKAPLMETNFPAIPKALIEHLNELFPDACPRLDTPEREIWWRAGQRSLVEVLQAEYERQTQEAMN